MQKAQKNTSEEQKSTTWWRAAGRILLRYGLPLFISVGLCYILFSKVDFRENVEIVSSYCDWRWIWLALGLSVVSHVIRALRWGMQLDALGIKVPLLNLVYSIFGTYAVNLVLPRLGEIWRTGYIANRQKTSFTKVFGSMVTDRLTDMVTVLLIILITFILASGTLTDYIASEPGRLESIKSLLSSSWLWTAAGILIVGAWIVLTRFPENRVLGKIRHIGRELWAGIAGIARIKRLWLWIFYSLALWACYFVQLYVAFYSFDFTSQIIADYGIEPVLVCFVFSTIATVLPSNGGYGPWQMAVIYGLSFYSAGISLPAGKSFEAMSIAFANCVMTTETILLIVLGIITFIGIAAERRHR